MTDSRITPNLWFDTQAVEAVQHYIAAFGGDGRVLDVVPPHPHPDVSTSPEGVPMLVEFELAGQRMVALNGGPQFTFTPAISLEVSVADQAELDRAWEALADGGQELPCGWVTDRYGVSWQVTPAFYAEAMASGDEAAKGRLMDAVLSTQGRFDIAALEAAFRGE